MINKDKITQFKKITKNFVLTGTLVAALITSPTFTTKAKAIEPYINPNGYYKVSNDGCYMQVNGNIDFSIIENMKNVDEISISNAIIGKDFSFNNSQIKHIVFRNCKFASPNFESYKSITAYSFIGCKFDNLNFLSNCSNVTNLNFDRCEVGDVDALKSLYKLESVNFYDVGIENIDFLKNNKNIKQLILVNTCVSDLSPIKYSNIEFLDVSDSLTIKDLSPVITLNNLQEFYSQNCEMRYTDDLYNFLKKKRVRNDIKKEELKIKYEIQQIANNIIDNTMSEKEKVFEIVNYVVDNIEYDYAVEKDEELSLKYNESALSYALDGIGCCKNYTALTTVLMQIAGIDVYEITGYNHIWNLIEVEGQYYWIDSTWLDGLDDVEILESSYYMNENYHFVDHDPFTVPISMYQDMYPSAEQPSNNISNTTENKSDNIIESTTNNVIDNIIESTTNNTTDDTTETITLENESEPTKETITTGKMEDVTVQKEESTIINKFTDDDVINIGNNNVIIKNLHAKKASVGVIVGIALALGFAKVAKIKKKNTNQSKSK